ncbi:MAG: MFS transporter [Proteobacteria bacterium]|nr:MFS transporter [Pseudomonadota bacterium]
MSQLNLLRTRRFLPLFLTHFLGALNDNLFKNALIILVTFKSGTILGLPTSQAVVLASGIFILPFFLFSATAGQLSDKYEKSNLIQWIKLAEIGIMVTATFGFLTLHSELLLLTLFLMGTHSTAFGPFKFAILPQHLQDSEVVGGNALVEAGTFLAILIGTILGGVLIAVEPHGPTYVSIGILATAVLGYLASRFIPKALPETNNISIQWNPIRPTLAVIGMARKNYNVFLAIMAISWFWFFGASFLSLFPVYAKESLFADQTVVTLFLALFSIGIAIGSLFCEAMSRQRLELGLVPFGSLGMSLFAADLYLSGIPGFPMREPGILINYQQFLSDGAGIRIACDLVGLAIFSGFFIVPLYSFIQIRTNSAERSRVIAANNIVNAAFMVAASLALVLFMNVGLTAPQIFFVLACMNAAVATYIYFYMPEFLLRFYAWCITNIMYRMNVKGHDHIPKEGPAVLVCNHVTYVDWLILAAGVKRPLRFVMDHSFYRGWLARTILNQAKVIPIASAKEDQATLDRAFVRIKAELDAGEVVCIFPEGKLTYDGAMNLFRPGIERMIATSPVPVIPMALKNVWGSYFSRKGGAAIKKIPRRFWSAISLEIGEAVSPEKATAAHLQQIVQELIDRPA